MNVVAVAVKWWLGWEGGSVYCWHVEQGGLEFSSGSFEGGMLVIHLHMLKAQMTRAGW